MLAWYFVTVRKRNGAMSIEYQFFPSHHLVYIRYSGLITAGELLNVPAVLYAHPQYQPGMSELNDYRGVTGGGAGVSRQTFHDLVSMERNIDEKRGQVRMAHIAPQDLIYGVARMYSMLSSSSSAEMRVFRSMPEALAWLDLPADLLD
jgi:hypothetical protein